MPMGIKNSPLGLPPRTRKQTSKTKFLDNNCSTPAKLHRKTVAPPPCQQWQSEGLGLCPQEDVMKPIPKTRARVVSKTRQGSWTFTPATWQRAPVPRCQWGLDCHHHLAVRRHPTPPRTGPSRQLRLLHCPVVRRPHPPSPMVSRGPGAER